MHRHGKLKLVQSIVDGISINHVPDFAQAGGINTRFHKKRNGLGTVDKFGSIRLNFGVTREDPFVSLSLLRCQRVGIHAHQSPARCGRCLLILLLRGNLHSLTGTPCGTRWLRSHYRSRRSLCTIGLLLGRRHWPIRLLGSRVRRWHAPLSRSRWHLHRHSRNPLEKYRLQNHAGRCLQGCTLSLLPVLGQLNQTNGNSEFLEVQAGRRGLISDRPDVLQGLNGKLRATKKFDRLGSADVSPSLDVGDFEQFQVVGLSAASKSLSWYVMTVVFIKFSTFASI